MSRPYAFVFMPDGSTRWADSLIAGWIINGVAYRVYWVGTYYQGNWSALTDSVPNHPTSDEMNVLAQVAAGNALPFGYAYVNGVLPAAVNLPSIAPTSVAPDSSAGTTSVAPQSRIAVQSAPNYANANSTAQIDDSVYSPDVNVPQSDDSAGVPASSMPAASVPAAGAQPINWLKVILTGLSVYEFIK